LVRFFWPEPSAPTWYTSPGSPNTRLLKVSLVPSADQLGSNFSPGASVILVCPKPSGFIRYTCQFLASSRVLTNAMAPVLPGKDSVPTVSAVATCASRRVPSNVARTTVAASILVPLR
jgi:hypothetical protein